jgi:hypothetical protein
MRSCPDAFHLCPRSAEHAGFSVLDRTTGVETAAATETEARQVAERNYPGCEFALSTIATAHKDVSSNVLDAVIMAVLRRLETERYNVVAYVVSSVGSAACIPFSAKIWPIVKDHLPHDQRRGS